MYNGKTVNAIGRTKAAQIYFRAQSVFQVDDSDFADHADALEASCSDLIGQSFSAVGSDPFNGAIGASDCAEVANAIAAVELRGSTAFCNFASLLDPRVAATCSATTTSGVTTPITSFNFESNPTDWTVSHESPSATFTPRDWTWVNTLPPSNSGFGVGSGFFGPTPNTVNCNEHDESGVLHLTSPVIPIPSSSSASFARATFEHWMSTEPGFDGGNLKISVNGGPFQLVPPSQFSFNNYTLILLSAADGNTNPLAGQPAWSGTNVGSIGGSWGRTHVDLGNFAPPGSNVQLRWDLGIDQCSARKGWYLDNVNVFSCVPNVPVVTIDPVASAPEASGAVVFTIRLSAPTIVPVAVTVETVDGSAIHGNDFDRIAGTVVIPASSATSLVRGVFVQVPVKDDKVSEGHESFTFRITNVSNGTLDTNNATATGTILDDD
jgi:hypothetical protein